MLHFFLLFFFLLSFTPFCYVPILMQWWHMEGMPFHKATFLKSAPIVYYHRGRVIDMRSDTNLHPWVPVDGVTLPLLPGMVGIDTRFMRLMFLLPTDIGLILDCIPCKWPANTQMAFSSILGFWQILGYGNW